MDSNPVPFSPLFLPPPSAAEMPGSNGRSLSGRGFKAMCNSASIILAIAAACLHPGMFSAGILVFTDWRGLTPSFLAQCLQVILSSRCMSYVELTALGCADAPWHRWISKEVRPQPGRGGGVDRRLLARAPGWRLHSVFVNAYCCRQGWGNSEGRVPTVAPCLFDFLGASSWATAWNRVLAHF